MENRAIRAGNEYQEIIIGHIGITIMETVAIRTTGIVMSRQQEYFKVNVTIVGMIARDNQTGKAGKQAVQTVTLNQHTSTR